MIQFVHRWFFTCLATAVVLGVNIWQILQRGTNVWQVLH